MTYPQNNIWSWSLERKKNLKLPLLLTTPRFDSNFKIVFITILTSSKLGYKYVNNKSEYLDSNTFMNQQFNPLVYTLTSFRLFSWPYCVIQGDIAKN